MTKELVTLDDLIDWNNNLDIFNSRNSDLSQISFADDVPPEFVALWNARIEADKIFWANWNTLTNKGMNNPLNCEVYTECASSGNLDTRELRLLRTVLQMNNVRNWSDIKTEQLTRSTLLKCQGLGRHTSMSILDILNCGLTSHNIDYQIPPNK